MGENIRVNENLFVMSVDMDGRSVGDIARDAAERIIKLFEQIGREHEETKKKRECLRSQFVTSNMGTRYSQNA